MKVRLPTICALAVFAFAATAQFASAALPRPGYWQARIGRSGPMVGMLVADSGRQISTIVGRMDVACPDGHTHTINFGSPNVAIDPAGAFSVSHQGPPDEFDHPGFDGWRFGGAFTSRTRAAGAVHLLWTGEGEACHAPSDRRTWTAHWRAEPRLTLSPGTVRRGSMLTLRGRDYLPRETVHIELPNRVHIESGSVFVLQQHFMTRADSRGRFTARVKVVSRMTTSGFKRAQAWQLECTTVCWVHADAFYHVSR